MALHNAGGLVFGRCQGQPHLGTWLASPYLSRGFRCTFVPICCSLYALFADCEFSVNVGSLLACRCTTVTMGLKSGIVGLPNVGKVRQQRAIPRV